MITDFSKIGVVSSIQFSPGGSHLLAMAHESKVSGVNVLAVWDITSNEELILIENPERVSFTAVRFLENGGTLMIQDSSGVVSYWDLEKGSEIRRLRLEKKKRMTAETLLPLVKEYAFREKPGLNPSTRFEIEEFPVEGLEETLDLQLFHVRSLSSDGQQFSEMELIYRDGALTPFANAFGGFGLMSAVLAEDGLYYTYSWGSGIHRSHVGRLCIEDGRLAILESGGYVNTDLFVRKVKGGIKVESGRFTGFNSWEAAEKFGWLKQQGSSLVIVDEEGAKVPPEFPVEEQGKPRAVESDKK